jgi:NAD(P)-dependent dehydrogenase (short-subunit alcohol dehydrogenase family)
MSDTVFITGADSGLGLALATRFLDAGFTVLAGCFGSPDLLRQLADRFPGRLTIVAQDVADLASVRRSVAEVAAATDHLDILINNAGVCPPHAQALLPDLDLADGHLQRVMEVNAFGPLRVIQQLFPFLEKGRLKRIVNISSEAGSIADCCRESWFAYCMSKAALNAESHLLQRWLKPRGFKVLAVHPGWMRTGMGGPGADITPDESARGIFALATRDGSLDDHIYMDYTGKLMNW